MVVKELSQPPFVTYAVLKYPELFMKYNLLAQAINEVAEDDIVIFIAANQHNVDSFTRFAYQNIKTKIGVKLEEVAQVARQKLDDNELIIPHSPLPMLQFIINGDVRGFN